MSFRPAHTKADLPATVVYEDEVNTFTVGPQTITGQLLLPTSGAGGGIVIGGDVELYRNGIDLLRSEDTFSLPGGVLTGGDVNMSNAAARLMSTGIAVVGPRQAAVADAAGGATIDVEARAAINALLARVRTHGLIAP